MSEKAKNRLTVGLVALVLAAPLYCCTSLFYGAYGIDWRLDMSISRYPEADLILKAQYALIWDYVALYEFYGTSDDAETVKQYYANIALPFVENQTIYHPFGGTLELGPRYELLFPGREPSNEWYEERYCTFTQEYACVEIEVLEYPSVALDESSTYQWKQAEIYAALRSQEEGSEMNTLIIYSYDVDGELHLYPWDGLMETYAVEDAR